LYDTALLLGECPLHHEFVGRHQESVGYPSTRSGAVFQIEV
jgi:hypothetical protein